jgi:hypothetical protein
MLQPWTGSISGALYNWIAIRTTSFETYRLEQKLLEHFLGQKRQMVSGEMKTNFHAREGRRTF